MKKFILSVTFAFAGILITSAQAFEGIIEFKKQTITDTVNYIYNVKGDKVRLDEIGNKSKKVEGSFIINLKTNSIISLNHDRKLYIEQASGSPATLNGKCEVKKTDKEKTIQGITCYEYVVSNPEEKVQVTYWMGSNQYDFFFKLLKVLNRKEKSAVFIQQIANADGMFPFFSSQVNLETGKEEARMEVTKVEKKTIDATKFDIPKDYQKFQK